MQIYCQAAVAILPVLVLVYLMVKRNAWPSYKALPLAAVLAYLLKILYFHDTEAQVNATVVKGALDALAPMLIVGGAISLFKVMEISGSMDGVRAWLNRISPNPVAQLMIVSFAFVFMIEGISGFGMPPALAAPLLVGLGFAPLKVAICCLIMNSFSVSFGGIGMPTWLGLGNLGLDHGLLMEVSWKTALLHSAAALVLPVVALRAVLAWAVIRENLLYVYLAVLGCMAPYLWVATWSCEFPALIGGASGLAVAVLLAHWRIGLAEKSDTLIPPGGENYGNPGGKSCCQRTWGAVKAFFPLWGSILLLLLTRLEFMGIKERLVDRSEWCGVDLGGLGKLRVSAAMVTSLQNIGGTEVTWECALLYLPAIIPFGVVVLLTLALYRLRPAQWWNVASAAGRALRLPAASLLFAMVLVALLLAGGGNSPAELVGRALARFSGAGWFYIAPYLGALGAFFSGSNTIANLTFGGIQQAAARALGLDETTVLALQSVGGALGHLVCVNSIVAVGSILGLSKISGYEGMIMKRTCWSALLYGALAILTARILL